MMDGTVCLGMLISRLGQRLGAKLLLSWSPSMFRPCLFQLVTTRHGHEHTRYRKRPQQGSRYLTDPRQVFHFNNWDNVVWDESQELEALGITQEQAKHTVAGDIQEKHEEEANEFWNSFYEQHQNRFFKDRHWLFTEFPELATRIGELDSGTARSNNTDQRSCDHKTSEVAKDVTWKSEDEQTRDGVSKGLADNALDCSQISPGDTSTKCVPDDHKGNKSFPGEPAHFRILEVGCGVGNTVFPILQTNNDPGLMVYCCDFSSTAIQLVKDHSDYDPRRCHAFVFDVTSEDSTIPFPENSLDIIILIFVLSAIHPDKRQSSVSRLARHLKPGGIILFRDYGRYDMAQLRFKKGRCLSENFYVRGDGTRVYFFKQDDLRELFTAAGLVEEQNLVDRRLQVNRGRQLKMYRVWIQCKYKKPCKQTSGDLDLSDTAAVSHDHDDVSAKIKVGDEDR